MMTTATHNAHDTTPERVPLMAFTLRENTRKLGCTIGPGQQPRERTVAARHQARWLQEIAQVTRRCGLPATAPVVRCDAAGREGVWPHRFLQTQGLTNSVVDSSSIEVNCRTRRAKSQAQPEVAGGGLVAYDLLYEAMNWYEQAEGLRPTDNNDAPQRYYPVSS